MKTKILTLSFGLSLVTLGLVACGSADPASPEEAQSRINETLPTLADSTGQGLRFLSESDTLRTLRDFAGAVAKLTTSDSGDSYEEDGFDDDYDDIEEDNKFEIKREHGQEIAEKLNSLIFTKEQYEGDGYFLLNGTEFCSDGDVEKTNTDCEESFLKMELRVFAEKSAGGLQLTLLVGPDRYAPAKVTINKTSVELTVDLAETEQAAKHIATATEEEFSFPVTMNGKLSLSLIANGNKDLAVEFSVIEDISIVGNEAGKLDGLKVSMAATEPTLALRADGIAKSLEFIMNVGATKIAIPGKLLDKDEETSALYELDLKGLSGTLKLDVNSRKIEITAIGFGDGTSTLKANNDNAFSLDFNKDYNRKMDMTISMENETPQISLSPALALSLYVDLRVLNTDDDVPSFLAGETYDVSFTGENPRMSIINESQNFNGGFRIDSGTFAVSSTSGGTVSVNAGHCLSAQEAPEDAHPILGSLLSGDCP